MPTPRKVNGNSKGEGDFKSPIFFVTKERHQNGISGGVGGGVQFKKNPSIGGVWIFSGTTQFVFMTCLQNMLNMHLAMEIPTLEKHGSWARLCAGYDSALPEGKGLVHFNLCFAQWGVGLVHFGPLPCLSWEE